MALDLSTLAHVATAAAVGLEAFGNLAPETQAAWWYVGRNQEALGFLVFDRVIRLDHAYQAVSGSFQANFAKQKLWVEEMRETRGNQFWEWNQWLSERLDDRQTHAPRQGAWEIHRAWKP